MRGSRSATTAVQWRLLLATGEERTRVARQPAVRGMAAARPPGLVASAAKRQGVGACAAPAPLPPRAPRQVPGFITARRRRGGTTPSAYAAQAARSIHGENSPRDIRGRTAGKRDHGEAGHARQGWAEAGRMVQPEQTTRKAGGLLWPYKGLLPAAPKDAGFHVVQAQCPCRLDYPLKGS